MNACVWAGPSPTFLCLISLVYAWPCVLAKAAEVGAQSPLGPSRSSGLCDAMRSRLHANSGVTHSTARGGVGPAPGSVSACQRASHNSQQVMGPRYASLEASRS